MRGFLIFAPVLVAATPVLLFPSSQDTVPTELKADGTVPSTSFTTPSTEADPPPTDNSGNSSSSSSSSPNGFTPNAGAGTADGPSPNEIQIISASFSGNGCPQGSVSTSISPDKTVITFGFDKFQTYIGPGYDPTMKTKNCQLHLNLRYPGGFQFSVVDSTYHGFAQLEQGVTGNFYSTYYFSQDASATTTTQTSIAGGGAWANGQVYTKNDKIPTASYIFSPCGANGILNINNRIALSSNNPQATGEVTDDDATVAFTQQIHLNWRTCRGR